MSARPSDILERELADALQRARSIEVAVLGCGGEGATHRVRFDGETLVADHHDRESESILEVMGGVTPTCMRIVKSFADATVMALWNALADVGGTDPRDEPLSLLPESLLRILLASALASEFAASATAVRDAVARVCLGLIASDPRPIEGLAPAFRRTREFPRWDVGTGEWSEHELVAIGRWFARPTATSGPRLQGVPSEPLARSATARYLRGLLGPVGVMRVARLRPVVDPSYRQLQKVLALLIAEGVVESDDGTYILLPAHIPTRRKQPAAR